MMSLCISTSRRTNRFAKSAIGILLLCLLTWQPVGADQPNIVRLPITIDYPLLRALTIHTAFTGPNQTAQVLDVEDSCTTVTISDPQFTHENGLVRFETFINLRAGKSFGDHCFMPVTWQGYLVLFQQPEIDPESWQLSFKTIDSIVYNRHHQPEKIIGILWKLMKSWVYPYLDQIHIDLTPPVADLKYTLSPMFSSLAPKRTQKILDSMRPGNILVTADHVQVNIHIKTLPLNEDTDDESIASIVPLSKNELDRFITVWETWDALLVSIISSMADKSLSEDSRQILLDTLLDTRHRFTAALASDQIGKKFIKEQFLWVWEQIAPIFRTHLSGESTEQALGYLAFFTASDALAALDKLGPSLGIELSREGLIRLARLLGESSDSLRYRPEPDIRLRKIFKFKPFPGENTPVEPPSHPEDPKSPGTSEKTHSSWLLPISYLITPCQVLAGEKQTEISRLKPWIVPRSDVTSYLERIKKLLNQTATTVIHNKAISNHYDKLFIHLTYSTAWQESCFRQFHTHNNQLVYIRSYNGSSVGLMQINERVWRGIYDLNRLRWDIHYNAGAGCDIIATYFRRYVLKRFDQIKTLNMAAVAGIVYAMYNGGPSQFNKFLTRLKTGRLQLSDRLFKEKYTWVVNNKWEYINRCLVIG